MSEGNELVGVAEAARLAGITVHGIRAARARGLMPDPVPITGSKALLWRRSTIEEWVRTRHDRPGPRPRSEGGDA